MPFWSGNLNSRRVQFSLTRRAFPVYHAAPTTTTAGGFRLRRVRQLLGLCDDCDQDNCGAVHDRVFVVASDEFSPLIWPALFAFGVVPVLIVGGVEGDGYSAARTAPSAEVTHPLRCSHAAGSCPTESSVHALFHSLPLSLLGEANDPPNDKESDREDRYHNQQADEKARPAEE